MRYAITAAAVLLAGCQDMVCTNPSGTYEWTYTETAGDCGPIDPSLATPTIGVMEGSWFDVPCTIQQTGTAAQCTVERVVECNGSSGDSLVYDWVYSVSEDGRDITADMSVRYYSSPGVLGCQSTYAVDIEWVAP